MNSVQKGVVAMGLQGDGVVHGVPALLHEAKRCDGCGKCVEACAQTRSEDDKTAMQQMSNGEGEHLVVVCRQCHDAPCVSACMSGCRYKDEASGKIVTMYERCVGCWMCVMVCPFGAIQPMPARAGEHHGKALKCDGCSAYDNPPCIDACDKQALVEVRPGELARKNREAAAMVIGAGVAHGTVIANNDIKEGGR